MFKGPDRSCESVLYVGGQKKINLLALACLSGSYNTCCERNAQKTIDYTHIPKIKQTNKKTSPV